MPTLREYYETDFTAQMGLHATKTLTTPEGKSYPAILKVHYSHEAFAKFASIYLPDPSTPIGLIMTIATSNEWMPELEKHLVIETGFPTDGRSKLTDCEFTGRVYVYVDGQIDEADRSALVQYANSAGRNLIVRDQAYLRERAKWDHPLAFISYDSRDRDTVARPLAEELTRLACSVWYDEFALSPGDRLREKIEAGIRECEKCILVLSENFFANTGWTKSEFESVFSREINENKRLILPIWHKVTKQDVYNYCLWLPDIVAVNWTLGKEEVAQRLRKVILQR